MSEALQLYDYYGLHVILAEPVPVYILGRFQERETIAVLQFENGIYQGIKFLPSEGHPMLDDKDLEVFESIIESRLQEIINHWIGYFIYHKPADCETITRKIQTDRPAGLF